MSDEPKSQAPAGDPPANVDDNDKPSKGVAIPPQRLREETEKRHTAEAKLAELETQNSDREKKELEAQGKHQEVIAKQQQELDSLNGKFHTMLMDRLIESHINSMVNVSDPGERADSVAILSRSVNRSKLEVKDGELKGLTEQTDEMKGRSTYKKLFGEAANPDDGKKPTDTKTTTTGTKPNNATKTVEGSADVQTLRKMSAEEFKKYGDSLGIQPVE